jgi:biotin carboxyl carrier protein
MSTRNRILFFVTAWLIVLMPFLFWWNTWFGRHLSDKQLTEYLRDDRHPRHIQHALVQLGDRMSRQDKAASQWYPDLIRLGSHPVEEVRNTDAWALGQDTTAPGFQETLTRMLTDPSPLVRGNAALSLVRFGDASGKSQILALLQPIRITSPTAGKVVDLDKIDTAVHQGGLIAKLDTRSGSSDVRSPMPGRISSLAVQIGQQVASGVEVAILEPSPDQVWEALRALYLIGQPDDLPAIQPYERNLPEIPDHIRQQATLTAQAIRDRAKPAPR